MKTLLLTENWPPRVGGIERYLVNMMRNLDSEKKLVVAPFVSSEEGIGEVVSIIQRRFYVPWLRPQWLSLYWYVRKLVKREEINLLLCGKALFEGLLGYYLKKKLGIPYVVFTYAMEVEEWTKDAKTKKKLERALAGADKVVYINEVTKGRLVELGVRDEQLVKIQPGVEDRFFEAQEGDKLLQKYGITKPYVLSVGRLIPRKGFDDLIEAFARLDQVEFEDVQLVIVGEGDDKERLEKIAEREMVAPKFLGHVDEKDLPAVFAGAGAFALTPKEVEGDIEGFGIVYLEAGAAGVPVIGTRSGGASEAIVDGKTGLLVESEDIGAITSALADLLSETKKAQQLGEQGKVRARDEFSWERKAKELKNALTQVV